MSVREKAIKEILRRKLNAESNAERNINEALKDDDIKLLFLKCKKLIVDIAKVEVGGIKAKDLRDEYNATRDALGELLKKKGIDKSTLNPIYNCNKCKDTGIIGVTDCECLKKAINNEYIKLSGIDISKFATFSDNYDVFENKDTVKVIYEKMKKFIDEINNTQIDVVVIMGGTGVGKTHLIECMTTYALTNNKLIKYSSAFNFNQDMLKYHCAKLEEKEDILAPYLNSEILFIDDLGTENKINNVTNEYLYLVINDRMANHKKTVITTNLDFAQIQSVYGERIFSRLVHKKHSLKINFVGNDLRVKK